LSLLQNDADDVNFCVISMQLGETPASAWWYHGVANNLILT
jgi:hypothetical protein